jgi:hypothetical protein
MATSAEMIDGTPADRMGLDRFEGGGVDVV